MNADDIKKRIFSVDFLRGVVMMLMLLDHTRDYVHAGALQTDPTDPATTTVALFFTRWITHYCAPTFVFLSGVSIYLQRMNGKSNGELARFLVTRGLWLIFFEFTLLRFGLTFNFDYSFFGLAQVIWVIGVSMIVMAALIWLPLRVVGAVGVLMIFLHNLFDRIQVPPEIAFAGTPPPTISQALWIILHQPGVIPVAEGSTIFVAYPLIPWIGVMAAGFAAGAMYTWTDERRRKVLLYMGAAAIMLFVVIRFTNVYGDPVPWTPQQRSAAQQTPAADSNVNAASQDASTPPNGDRKSGGDPSTVFTFLSFLNTTKYPPSLLFLLMTLGPAMIVLGLSDRIDGKAIWQRIAITFGRVPMFYYLLQMPLAHAWGVVLSLLAGKDIAYLFINFPANAAAAPPDHGFPLWVVYAAWIAGLILLYPLCLWWGNLKRRNKHWILSYL
jgi:uncharacterized membrane protein